MELTKVDVMRQNQKNYKPRILFLLGLIVGLLLFYISGPTIQARQVLRDVEYYIKLKEMTPSVVQLRKQSATFRNTPRKCPCYKQLSQDRFEIEYHSRFNNVYIYDDVSRKWNQIKSK